MVPRVIRLCLALLLRDCCAIAREAHASSAQVDLDKPTKAQKFAELKENLAAKAQKGLATVNKEVSRVNGQLQKGVGNFVSKSNSAVDDIQSAAGNAVQGLKDFTESASQPIVQAVSDRTAIFNKRVGTMVGRINKAIEDMKNGVHDLAHGMTDGLKEASEKIAAQLAQSVHEHVRQEIELARAAEPAS
mmetsp:Transcript_42522/g.121203  ORF Transcript_42522/g.121203 Transcript_42522/m.121203 type:complete len:189 (-) Transcript_42522:87-653(-)